MKESNNHKVKKNLQLNPDDYMVIIVSMLIIFGILTLWIRFEIDNIIRIPLTIILIFSLYYQVMVWLKQTNFMMVGMEVEDRYLNELAYHSLKAGYQFKIETTVVDPDDPISDETYKIIHDIPPVRKSWIKLISLFFVILFPAWRYRDYEGIDDIYDDEVD